MPKSWFKNSIRLISLLYFLFNFAWQIINTYWFLNSNFLGGSWYRYVVTGEVTGGRLKTPADADKESLQAKWISDLGELSLRANDVLTLVEKGRQYYAKALTDPWHSQQVLTLAWPHF